MRKLVLGILAVFCVQFAFVIFTSLQSPLEVAVGPIYSDSQAQLPFFEPAETDDGESSLPEQEDTASNEEPKVVDERRIAPTSLRRSEPSASPAPIEVERPRAEFPQKRPVRYFTSDSDSAAGAFETVVISYDRNAAISDCEMNNTPKPRKRSYIAKAAPVVKKPWEWIKAVGSKFN